jgi:phenylalanyl-tRNA synthetase beta chain
LKFSYNWISELVNGLELPPRDLSRLITMKTAECEGIEPMGAWLSSVCGARVLSAETIEGGHNRKAIVETGRYGTKTVVCGAPNCRAGMVTAYVPSGTGLSGKRIEKISIGGIESDGMLASGAELGLNRDASGILELDANPGDPLPGCTPDQIIEIDNKSITHRPDLWGHYGMAREVAAITRKVLLDPVKSGAIPDAPAAIGIEIQDFDLCPRYSALVFDNVKVGPSPLWLQYRLESVGLNPINNIVDVTNYVMAELAQPMHAFDHDLLRGETIFVQHAPEGAVFVALNGESYTLDSRDTVIADAGGPIALAGVIGGLDSAIGERTTRIVLESACFNASAIRKTSSRVKLRTDASMRFEKAQDPVNTVRGLARALELLREVSPGIRLVGGLAEQRREQPAPPPIVLPMDWLLRKLGRSIEAAEVQDILERLAFGVTEIEPRVFSVTVPSWRATKDVSIQDDLVEEVGRMIGYDSITPVAPLMAVTVPPPSEERMFHRSVRRMLAAQGFSEVYNYSFISDEQAAQTGFEAATHVAVANPISSDQGLMRLSLIPGIYQNINENSKHLDTFRLFEIGQEIHSNSGGLPNEVPHAVAVLYTREDGAANLLELKRVAQCVLPEAEVVPGEARAYEHPARAGDVVWRGNRVGRLFEFHPSLVTGRAAVLDLDLQLIFRLGPSEKKAQPIRRFPTSAFDLSVVAGMRDLVGEIQEKLTRHAGEQLVSIEFVRQYSGSPIPEGQKSVSFRLTVGASDHTLSLEEIGAIRSTIIESMRQSGYELRV